MEYNFFNLENFVVRQCAPSLKAFILANGGDVGKLMDAINKAQLSKKHDELLDQLKIGGSDIHRRNLLHQRLVSVLSHRLAVMQN